MHRIALVVVTLIYSGLSASGQERVWKVKPDPIPSFKVVHKDGVSIGLGKDGGTLGFLRFPTTPSPFFVFRTGGVGAKSFLIDLRNGSPVPTFPQPTKSAPAILAICPSGEYIAYGQFPFGGTGDPLAVEAYSCKTGKLLAAYRPEKDTVLEWVDFGTSGRLLLSLRKQIDEKKKKRTLEIRDLAKGGELLHTINQPLYNSKNQPHAYVLSPGRRHVFLPYLLKGQFKIRVYDLESGELAGDTVFFAPDGTLRELAVSPDGSRLACLALNIDHSLHVFDMTTGERKLHRHLKVGSLLFDFAVAYGNFTMGWAGDSTHVYIKSRNVWNVDTGEYLTTKTWPSAIATAVPDGQIMMSGKHALHLTTIKK